MNIDKCKTCKHYDSFFDTCDLYIEEIYIDDGDFDLKPISIKYIDESDCEYEPMKGENNDRQHTKTI